MKDKIKEIYYFLPSGIASILLIVANLLEDVISNIFYNILLGIAVIFLIYGFILIKRFYGENLK